MSELNGFVDLDRIFLQWKNKVKIFILLFNRFLNEIYCFQVSKKATSNWSGFFSVDSNEFRVFEGIIESIKKLSKNWKVIIISSNWTDFIKTILKYQNISWIEDVIWWDIEKSKIKKINWQKKKYINMESYYIWDTTWDIKEAKITWVKSVWVTWGFHSKEKLFAENPDYLFDIPKELENLI